MQTPFFGNVSRNAILLVAGMLIAGPALAGPLVRQASGPNAAAIQATVDQFRTDLGGANNGVVAGSQPTGRREITRLIGTPYPAPG